MIYSIITYNAFEHFTAFQTPPIIKGGRGNFVSGAMSYYARKKDFAWGIG